jgi:hypothetical protein
MEQPDGSNYYMDFASIDEYADYYNRVWGPYIAGIKDSETYAARLKAEGYYGADKDSYRAGIENGMDNLPGDSGSWAEKAAEYVPTSSFTIPTTDPVLTRGFMPGAGRSGFMPISYSGGSTSNVINVGGITVNGANATADEIGRSVGDQLMTRLQHSADFFRMGAANTSILV